jgi:hypothetical protein
VVEDDHVGSGHPGRRRQLFQFAAADQGRRVRAVALLQSLSGNHGSGAGCQLAKLLDRFLGSERDQVFARILPRLQCLSGLARGRRYLPAGQALFQ